MRISTVLKQCEGTLLKNTNMLLQLIVQVNTTGKSVTINTALETYDNSTLSSTIQIKPN
jgi:hypothetical protein